MPWLLIAVLLLGYGPATIFARRWYLRLEERGRASKAVWAAIGIVACGFVAAAGAFAFRGWSLESRVAEEAARVQRAAQAVERRFPDLLAESERNDELLRLLRGEAIPRRPSFRQTPLTFVGARTERRAGEENLPFRVCALTLAPGEKARFESGSTHTHIARVAVALEWGAGGNGARAQLSLFGANAARRDLAITGSAARSHGWGDAESETEIVTLDLTPSAEIVDFVEIAAGPEPITVRGVTLVDGGASARPLTPYYRTRSGVPVEALVGSGGRGVRIAPNAEASVLEAAAPAACDQLCFVYCVNDPKAVDYPWYGEEIVEVRMEYEGSPSPETFTLKHGVETHSCDFDRSSHSPELSSGIAFVWDADGQRWHADQLMIKLSERKRLRKLTLKNLSGSSGYAVELIGVTALTAAPEDAGGAAAAEEFKLESKQLRLADALQIPGELLAHAVVNSRGQCAAADGEAGARLAGMHLDDDLVAQMQRGASPPPREVDLGSDRWIMAVAPFQQRRGENYGLVVAYLDADRAAAVESYLLLPLLLAGFLSPFLMVALARSIGRAERTRDKLMIGIGVAVCGPLAALIFLVPASLDRRTRRMESQRIDALLEGAAESLRQQSAAAAQEASLLMESLQKHSRAIPVLTNPDRADTESTLANVLGNLLSSRQKPAGVVSLQLRFQRGGKAERRTIVAGGGEAAAGFDAVASGVFRVDQGLAAVGVARYSTQTLRAQLVVRAPVRFAGALGSGLVVLGLDGVPLLGSARYPFRSDEAFLDALGAASDARSSVPFTTDRGARAGFRMVRNQDDAPICALVAAPSDASGFSLADLLGSGASPQPLIPAAFIVILLSAAALAYLTARSVSRSVERLAAASAGGRGGAAPETLGEDEPALIEQRIVEMSSELAERAEDLNEIRRGMMVFGGRLSMKEVAASGVRFAASSSGADQCILLMPRRDGRSWTALSPQGEKKLSDLTPLMRSVVAAREWTYCADSGPTPFAFLAAADRAWIGDASAVLGGALQRGGSTRAYVYFTFRRTPTQNQLLSARTAATAISVALENAAMLEAAGEDQSTGTLSAASFQRRLQEAIERARALGNSVQVGYGEILAAPDAQDPLLADVSRRLLRMAERIPMLQIGRADASRLAWFFELPPSRQAAVERYKKHCERWAARSLAGRAEYALAHAAFPADGASAAALAAVLQRAFVSPGVVAGAVDLAQFCGCREDEVPQSGAMVEVLKRAQRVSRAEIPVLLVGEHGVGKEWLARRIHAAGRGEAAPFVALRAGAIPADLAEAEIFGVAKGAYTGAGESRPGLLEAAQSGTLFLAELQELSADVQVKLLRALQQKRFRRIGSSDEVEINFQLTSSISTDYEAYLLAGRIRQDFYYRLAGLLLHIPSLAQRRDDISPLTRRFMRELAPGAERSLADDALKSLQLHDWPGNVIELRTMVQRALLNAGDSPVLTAAHFELGARDADRSARPIVARAAIGGSSSSVGDQAGDERWHRQHRLLALLEIGNRFTTKEYVAMVGVSLRTGLRDLQDLVDRGHLKSEGQKKGMSFVLLRK